MKCYNCGNEIPQGAKYCLSCGRKVGDTGSAKSDTHAQGNPEHVGERSYKKLTTRFPYGLKFLFFIVVAVVVCLIILFR